MVPAEGDREPQQQPQGGCLSSSVGSEQPEAFPAGDFEIQPIDCDPARVAFDESGNPYGRTRCVPLRALNQRGGPLRNPGLCLRLAPATCGRVTP